MVEKQRTSRSPSVDSNRISVAIVDDHQMMAQGLTSLLQREDDLEVVGSAATIAQAIDLVSKTHPTVVLMDYQLPDGDGAYATREM